jgi:acetyl esterase/lipase
MSRPQTRRLGPLRFILLCTIVGACSNAQNENQPTAEYSVQANVQYCTGAGKPLLMDVFVPHVRIRRPTPAVLWLHGGGWERGDKNGSSGARFLASAGFVSASIYYRLSGEAKFPANIEDCKCAIRFLRVNARRYELDPDRIGIAGASSGGHLALLAGLADERAGLEGAGGWANVSSRVSAIASYYGPTDLTAISADFGTRAQAAIIKLIGTTPQESPATYRRASPISYVVSGKPAILMFHGNGDTLVPVEQSKRMLDACLRAGLPAELIKVGNANHDFELVDSREPLSITIEQIHSMTVEFFKKQLLPPPSGN